MPRPGEPCSGYLIRSPEAAVLLDIGTGVFAHLQLAIDYTRIDAVVVSHMHADHFFDVVPFRYALKYGHLRKEHRVMLWLPPGGRDALEALRRAVSSDTPADFFENVFHLREYAPDQPLRIRDLDLRFCRTRHYVEAYAARVDYAGQSLTYSADTAPCDAVVDLARASSVFLCEATLALGSELGERGHASAFEAGEMAARAAVDRLILTHYPEGEDPGEVVTAAARAFRGPVELARSGLELVV
jgi:ribonuclease BN (tRNA processing enzyme)